MKTHIQRAPSAPRRRSKGILHQLQARLTRLPAHMTSEDDWRQDAPGVRLSRVFGVVLGIHVVAIGGLMAYEMFRHRDSMSEGQAALRPAAREMRTAAASPVSSRAEDAAVLNDPANAGLKVHQVLPGERISEIAAKYQVDENALVERNRLRSGRPFESGMRLVIPNRQFVAAAPEDLRDLLAKEPATGAQEAVPEAHPLEMVPVTAPKPGAAGSSRQAVAAQNPAEKELPVRRAELVFEADGPAAKPKARPQAEIAAKKSTPPKKPAEVAAVDKNKPKAKGRVHVVKDGETAYRIARAYGVNVDQLVKSNGIKPTALKPGTTLTIPASSR